MATRERTRTRDPRIGTRPAPDEAYIEDARPDVARPAGGPADGAPILNVIAGIWLVISPFVLGYTAADATWNPIVFGAAVIVIALARIAGGVRTAGLSVLNMAIGAWIFISAFWLASSSQATWNDIVMGIVVFVLAGWSAATPAATRTA